MKQNKREFDVMGTDTFENVPLQNALLSPSGRKVVIYVLCIYEILPSLCHLLIFSF